MYKSFIGGESVIQVNIIIYINNALYYGIFIFSGLQFLGEKINILFFLM